MIAPVTRSEFSLHISTQNGTSDMTCLCVFRLRRLSQIDGPGRHVRHFPCTFPNKMALLTCPYAFRLRRLAQNVCRGSRAWHFPCTFPRPMALVTCPGAFRVHRLSCNGRCGISALHSPVHTGSCGLSLCLETSSKELARRSCQEICCVDLVRRSCQETSHRDLANRTLLEILYRDLGRRPLIESPSSPAVAAASRTAPAVRFHSPACAQHSCERTMQTQGGNACKRACR